MSEEYLKMFLNVVGAGKAESEDTLKWYRNRLTHFSAWIDDNFPDEPFSRQAFNAFIAYLKAHDYAVATVRGYVVILRRLGRWLREEEYVSKDPAANLAYPSKERMAPKGISSEDVKKMLQNAQCARDRAMVRMLYDSGMRAGEMISLTWGNINFERNSATVMGKYRKRRVVFFTDMTRKDLLEYRASVPHSLDDPVWWSLVAPIHPLTYWGLYLRFKFLGELAQTDRYNPHSFRHNFGRRGTKNGCPTLALQALMGHESPETTRIYTYLDDEDLEDLHTKYFRH